MSYGGGELTMDVNPVCMFYIYLWNFIIYGLSSNFFQVPIVVVMLVECIHQAMVVNISLVVLMYDPSLVY